MTKKWLPQYKNEMFVGARNNNMCSYLVALEGWRRGLTLKWYSKKVKKTQVHAPGRYFSLSDGKNIHYFYKTKGDKISNKAITIGKDKDKTKEWLKKYNIPVPVGKKFSAIEHDETIVEFCNNELNYPVVIKPTDGFQGVGVIANIKDEKTLRESIHYVRNELKKKDVIVEEFVTGEEFRFYVVEDEVKAIIKRTPANVVGNGKHTINELINLKNKERKNNPRLFNCLIKVDFELKKNLKSQNLELNDIPEKGQQIMLRVKSNISTGGDSEEVLEEMPSNMKQLAIDTLKALPDLPHGGVDIIVKFDGDEAVGTVLEINAVPQIGSLVFPMKGQARDIPSAIIDYYFPDTINKPRLNDNVYFDFKNVLSPLYSKIASEVVVQPAPFWEKENSCIFTIKGKVQGVGFRRWARRKALENNLFGYAKNKQDGSVEVIVSGEYSDIDKFKQLCLTGPKKASVTEVIDNNWNGPVKVGFEIKESKKRTKPKKKIDTNIVKKSKNNTNNKSKKAPSLKSKIKRRIKRLIKK